MPYNMGLVGIALARAQSDCPRCRWHKPQSRLAGPESGTDWNKAEQLVNRQGTGREHQNHPPHTIYEAKSGGRQRNRRGTWGERAGNAENHPPPYDL
jgi:hypothetical protein